MEGSQDAGKNAGPWARRSGSEHGPRTKPCDFPSPGLTFISLRPSTGVDWAAGKGPVSLEGHCHLT